MTLSKSQYIRGLQCHKSLWLHKNKPELKDTPNSQSESLFNTGHNVGELACKLFPNGTEIKFDSSNFDGMIQKTKELISNDCEVIYEATFKEDGIFAMADILVKNGDAWDIYEVKASTGVKDYYLNDTAIQWYSISQAINLNRAYVIHIDNSYVRDGKLDIKKLFKIVDITDEVQNRQYQISFNLKEMLDMLDSDIPDIDIGGHCDNPHGCDFKSHCWKDIPYPSVFNLYWMNWSKKFEMYYKGMKTYEDIPSGFKLNATQTLQVSTYKSKEPFYNTPRSLDNYL